MTAMTRRQLLAGAGAAAALALTPRMVRGGTATPKVVVVGGGFGGATAAHYLRAWSAGGIDVTLVDAQPAHVSSILSNLVLNGQVGLPQLTFDWSKLSSGHGVKLVRGRVASIRTSMRQVVLADGSIIPYDRLVLSPGIEFDTLPGLDPQRVPHAWQAGPQTTLLRQQLTAMPNKGTFVMTIPAAPYRCPPGPYERACVVADFLKRKKGGGKVIVLDANQQITAEQHTFSNAFTNTYAGIVDYRPGTSITEVDSVGRSVRTSAGTVVKGNVLNVIPSMRAPSFLAQAGLVNDPTARWAGVNPLSYESTAYQGIHIIGDSQATGQPKAGHIANAEAKIAADAIIRAFAGLPPDPAPVTNSACFSPITASTASWLTVVFKYDPVTGTMKAAPGSLGEASKPSSENYERMFAWSKNLFSDTFG